MKCCLCGREFEGYGNNPYPLCEESDYESRCCNDCDSKFVVPARIEMSYTRKKTEDIRKEYLEKIRKVGN